jgi:hypothetical protein
MSLAEQQLFAKEPNNSFGPRDLVIRVGQTVTRVRVQQIQQFPATHLPQQRRVFSFYHLVIFAHFGCSMSP